MPGFDPIDLGSVADDRTGDNFRAGGEKINAQLQEIFTTLLAGSALVPISQESDFDVQDSSEITLEENKRYFITDDFSTAKRFIWKTGSSWTSSSIDGALVTFTGSGTMFTGTNESFFMDNARIDPGIGNEAFALTDNLAHTSKLLLNTVQVENCIRWGTFTGAQIIQAINSNSPNAEDGCVFVGTDGIFFSFEKFALISTNVGFKGMDLGSSTAPIIEFSNLSFTAPSGAFGISGLAASGNLPVGRLAMVSNCEFAGGMTPLENIASNDIRWNFTDNVPIPDSRNAADLFLTGGTETITTGSAGDWQEIGIPGGGGISWDSDIADRFTVGTNGVLTYVGERDIQVRMSGRATVEKVGGGADVLEVRIAKNWTGAASDGGLAKSRAQTQNADPTTVPIGALTTLTTNDNIRVIFSNVSGASNIDASVSSLEVTD